MYIAPEPSILLFQVDTAKRTGLLAEKTNHRTYRGILKFPQIAFPNGARESSRSKREIRLCVFGGMAMRGQRMIECDTGRLFVRFK